MSALDLDSLYATLATRVATMRDGGAVFSSDVAACTDFAIDANAADRADLSIALLEPMVAAVRHVPRLWQMLALAYRQEQKLDQAVAAFSTAAGLAPDDPLIAIGLAQSCQESGRPAAAHFRMALRLAPDALNVVGNAAVALSVEGNMRAADALLNRAVAANPDWIDGHQTLARLRWTGGQGAAFTDSLRAALRVRPGNGALWIALFRAEASIGAWDRAQAIIDDARRAMGNQAAFDAAEACCAAETGAVERADRLFAAIGHGQDQGVDLCRIRLYLRTGRFAEAEATCLALLGAPSATAIWPYLSIIWRLRGDARAAWLDGDPPYIRTFDLDGKLADMDALAALLQRLHGARAHLPDQSVRGGTQTDQPLFFRHEPEIREVKARVIEALRAYIADLPPHDAGHPFLGVLRGDFLFEGSWSVRLRPGGHHVAHTHPAGWISAVLYVALPPADAMGPAPAGWLRLGAPPSELGLAVAPYRDVEPRIGRLVLFPSTLWHETLPFADGERLTIAFDVRAPRR